MKHTIPLEDFMRYNKITFHDPMRCDAYYNNDYGAHALADIRGIEYTREQLEASPALRDALNIAIARAEETAYMDAYYQAQCNAIEKTAENIAQWINGEYPTAKMRITKFEAPDYAGNEGSLAYEGNARTLATVCKDIIEGEGMFHYEGSTTEFIQSYDGSNKAAQAVKMHPHYLMNGKLIADIWGDRLIYTVEDRDVDHLNNYADPDYLKECIADAIADDSENISDELAAIKYT